MAKIIPFPEPYDQQLSAAKRAIQAEDHLEAKQILDKLYQTNPTFEVSQLLVKLYVLEGQEIAALKLADEMEDEYLSSTEGIKQYFHLIVLNYQFIRAHILLNSGKHHQYFAEEQSMLELFEKVYEQTNLAVFEEKKCQFIEFQSLSYPVPQKQWNTWLVGITKSQYEKLVFPALTLKNSPFMNSRCCEVLVKIGEQRVHKVRNQLRSKAELVDFSRLSLLEKAPVFYKMQADVTENYSDQPFLFEALSAEIVGHWAYLFPFLPDETSLKAWINVYASDYQAENGEPLKNESVEEKEIQKTKQAIRHELAFFSNF